MQNSESVEIHILQPEDPNSCPNFMASLRHLSSAYNNKIFTSFTKMMSSEKNQQTRLYRVVSKDSFIKEGQKIRKLYFVENKFIVIEQSAQINLDPIPKDLMAYIKMISNHYGQIETHIQKYRSEKNRLKLPERFLFYYQQRSFLQGLFLLLEKFDKNNRIERVISDGAKKDYSDKEKLVFVAEVHNFITVYKIVAANYNQHQFAFIILSDYGNPIQQQKKFSQQCQVEILFFSNKEPFSNFFINQICKNDKQIVTTEISVQKVKNIFNVGAIHASENHYLTVFDIWDRESLKQSLEHLYDKNTSILMIKQDRISELSLIVDDSVSPLFVDKSKIEDAKLQVIHRNKPYLLIILSGSAKQILRLLKLQEFEQSHIKQIVGDVLLDDPDSQRIRKLERTVFKQIPIYKFFGIQEDIPSRIYQIQHPQFSNILRFKHSNYHPHCSSKDYIILNNIKPESDESFSSNLVVLSNQQNKLQTNSKFIQIPMVHLASYLTKQNTLIQKIRQSFQVLKCVGFYLLNLHKPQYELFCKKLTYDFRSIGNILIEDDQTSEAVIKKINVNKKQLNIVIYDPRDRCLKQGLETIIKSKKYKNIYFHQVSLGKVSFQEIFSLQYKLLQFNLQTFVDHNNKLLKDCPDYINVRIFCIQNLPIVKFIQSTISKKKVYKYTSGDQFLKVIKQFKSQVKQILIFKNEEWTQQFENLIQKFYISHLLNVQVIIIKSSEVYVLKTFKKNKSGYSFLSQDKLRTKIEEFKSIREQEDDQKKDLKLLQKELEELLIRQSKQLDRSFNNLSIHSIRANREKQEKTLHRSEYHVDNQSLPQIMSYNQISLKIGNQSDFSQTQIYSSEEIHNKGTKLSIQNLLLESEYDDYGLAKDVPSIKISASTTKTTRGVNNQKSKKMTQNSLKKLKLKNNESNSKQQSNKSKKSLSSLKMIDRAKSSTDLFSKGKTKNQFYVETTISNDDAKRFKQILAKFLKVKFLIYKKASMLQQQLKNLAAKDTKISQIKVFGKMEQISKTKALEGEGLIIIFDKMAQKSPKILKDCTMFYNSTKKKSSSERSFNFETERDLLVFLCDNFKKNKNISKSIRQTKGVSPGISPFFYIAFNQAIQQFKVLAQHIKEQYNCEMIPYTKDDLAVAIDKIGSTQILVIISKYLPDKQVEILSKIRINTKIHVFGRPFNLNMKQQKVQLGRLDGFVSMPTVQLQQVTTNHQNVTKEELPSKNIKKDSSERLKLNYPMLSTTVKNKQLKQVQEKHISQNQNKVMKSENLLKQAPKTIIPKKDPSYYVGSIKSTEYPLSVSTIYIFSSVKITSLQKSLESLGYQTVFLKPQSTSQIILFSQIISSTEFIIVNYEEQQNYNKILLSKAYNILVGYHLQSLLSDLKSKISVDSGLIKQNSIRQIKFISLVLFNTNVTQNIQKWQENSRFSFITFCQQDRPQKGILYFCKNNLKFELKTKKQETVENVLASENIIDVQNYLQKIQIYCRTPRIPFLSQSKFLIFFYQSEFSQVVSECCCKLQSEKIICSQFHMKNYQQIQRLLDNKNCYGLFLIKASSQEVYSGMAQAHLSHFVPIFGETRSQINTFKQQIFKIMWVVSHQHNVLSPSAFKQQFDIVKNGIQDLFQMQQQVQTLNISMSDSRISKSNQRSLTRSSSSRSKFPLLSRNKSNINQLVILTPEQIMQTCNLSSFVSQAKASIDLISYSNMEDVCATIRSFKKKQQYLMIFNHYHRLSQNIQQLLNCSRVIVIILTNRSYQQILRSNPNFIYILPKNLTKILSKVILKMNEKHGPINASISSEITQLKFQKLFDHNNKIQSFKIHVCYQNSEKLKTQYKKNQNYFVYCKENIDKKILRKNVYVFKDLAYLKYSFFKVLKNYFLVKLKERKYKQRIALPNRGTKVTFISQYTKISDVPIESFIVAPVSRTHQLSRFNKVLIYENQQQKMIINNLINFRQQWLNCEQTLPAYKKVLIYYPQSVQNTIETLKSKYRQLSFIKFNQISQISTENNLKTSLLICKIQQVPIFSQFMSKYPNFKFIVLNFSNKRNALKQSLFVPLIMSKQSQLAKYLATQLKLYYVTIFLDKRFSFLKQQIASSLRIKNEIHLVTSLQMKVKSHQVTGMGFYLSDENCIKQERCDGINFICLQGFEECKRGKVEKIVQLIENGVF